MPRPKKEKSEEMTETETTSTSPSESKETTGAGGKPKKTEMVRQAIEQGRKRKPLAIQAWILEKYGETVPTQHISTIKSNLRKNPTRKTRKSGEYEGEASGGSNGTSNSLSLEEIRIVKSLIGRIGRTRFQEVVDLLS